MRWNDLRKFRRRLLESREEAELRGSVTQAAEIEHLLAALEPPIGSLRAAAVTASPPQRPGRPAAPRRRRLIAAPARRSCSESGPPGPAALLQ